MSVKSEAWPTSAGRSFGPSKIFWSNCNRIFYIYQMLYISMRLSTLTHTLTEWNTNSLTLPTGCHAINRLLRIFSGLSALLKYSPELLPQFVHGFWFCFRDSPIFHILRKVTRVELLKEKRCCRYVPDLQTIYERQHNEGMPILRYLRSIPCSANQPLWITLSAGPCDRVSDGTVS